MAKSSDEQAKKVASEIDHLKTIDKGFGETEDTLKAKRRSALIQENADEESMSENFLSRENLDEYGHTGMTHKRTWETMGMKTALHVAAKNGYDGIALVDGGDIALAVGGPEKSLRKHYGRMGSGLTKHMRSLGTPRDEANPFRVRVGNDHVEPDKVVMSVISENKWAAGSTVLNEPIVITKLDGSIQGLPIDAKYMVIKDGIEHSARFGRNLDEAKQEAANFINEVTDKALEAGKLGSEVNPVPLVRTPAGEISVSKSLEGSENPYSMQANVWMIDDTARAEILRGQSMFQANEG